MVGSCMKSAPAPGPIEKGSARDNWLAAGLRGSAARGDRQGALRHKSVRRRTSTERHARNVVTAIFEDFARLARKA